MPVLSYGCEIWGPDVIGTSGAGLLRGEAELLHRSFMRSVLGVRKSTSIGVIMDELKRSPVMCTWLDHICRFWNRIVKRGAQGGYDLTYLCLRDSIQLATQHNKGWAYSVMNIVRKLTGGTVDMIMNGDIPIFCDAWEVGEYAYELWHDHAWDSLRNARQTAEAANHDHANLSMVQSCPDDHHVGFKLLKYDCWFRGIEYDTAAMRCWALRQSYVYTLHRYEHIRIIAQFRMASHWLGFEYLCPTMEDRSKRHCVVCHNVCEDELHLMKCPLYSDIRLKYKDHIDFDHVNGGGFSGTLDQAIQHAMNGYGRAFWTAFACYLLDCKDRRQRVIDGCWPVARVELVDSLD